MKIFCKALLFLLVTLQAFAFVPDVLATQSTSIGSGEKHSEDEHRLQVSTHDDKPVAPTWTSEGRLKNGDSNSRHLNQIQDASAEEEKFECSLSAGKKRRAFNEEHRAWVIDETVFDDVDQDLQAIINCTAESDAIVFRVNGIIKPKTTLVVPWNLTWKTDLQTDPSRSKESDENSLKTKFKSPEKGPLLVIRGSSFTMDNLLIVDRNVTDTILVHHPNCNDREKSAVLRIVNSTFMKLSLFGNASILDAGRSTCSRVEMEDVVIQNNKCSNADCIVLSQDNELRNIQVLKNRGPSNSSSEVSMFLAATGSTIMAQNIASIKNLVRTFHLSNSSLSLSQSQFLRNERNTEMENFEARVGGVVLFSNQSSVIIRKCSFKKNFAVSGGSIYSYSSNFEISGCVFRKNEAEAGSGGVLVAQDQSQISFSDSIFSKNSANDGGSLYIADSSNATIKNCSFSRNAAKSTGGAIKLYKTSSVLLLNSTFKKNKAQESGGGLYLEDNCTLFGSQLNFWRNVANDGSSVYLKSISSAVVSASSFLDNIAHNNAAGLQLSDQSVLSVQNSTFERNEAVYGGSLCVGSSSNITISNCSFIENKAKGYGGAVKIYESSTLIVMHSTFQGMIRFSASIIQVDMFVGNSGQEGGGGVHIEEKSSFFANHLKFYSNHAEYGASIEAKYSSFATLLNCHFMDNHAEINAGALHLYVNSTALIQNCTFESNACLKEISRRSVDAGNKAELGGCFHFDTNSSGRVEYCSFKNNTARRNGGAIQLYQSSSLTLTDSILQGNSASFAGSVFIESFSRATISQCSFERNTAERLGGAIEVYNNANLTVVSSVFNGNKAHENGGAVYVEDSSALFGSFLNISGNEAGRGGGFFLQSSSYANVSDSRFKNNVAIFAGGAMFIKSSDMETSLRFCIFSGNNATASGALCARSTRLEILNSSFRRNLATKRGGAIFVKQTTIHMRSSEIEANKALGDCGGMCLYEGSLVKGDKVYVVGNSAESAGGGVDIGFGSSVVCYACMFSRNTAFRGAGLRAQSNDSIPVVAQLQDSRFEENRALSYGGALDFEAPQNRSVDCTDSAVVCGRIVLLRTDFVENFAQFSGAAFLTTDPNGVLTSCGYDQEKEEDFLDQISLHALKPMHPNTLCKTWVRNQLANDESGAVVGTYGQTLVLSISPTAEMSLTGDPEKGYVLENVSSGKKLPRIRIKIFDGYGNGPAPTFPYSFEASMSSPDDFFSGVYTANVSGGKGYFRDIIGIKKPGDYGARIFFNNPGIPEVNLTINVRECRFGEEPTMNRELCQECDPISYNLDPDKPNGCTNCPGDGNCTGNFIVSKDTCWHKSPCHISVKPCLVDEACKYEGRQEKLLNFTNTLTECTSNETVLDEYREIQCKEGYKGPLCGSCDNKYGMSIGFRCVKCTGRFFSVLALSAIVAYLLVTASFTIRGSLPYNSKKAMLEGTSRAELNAANESSSGHTQIDIQMAETKKNQLVSADKTKKSQLISRQQTRKLEARDAEQSSQQPTAEEARNQCELTRWRTTEIFKITINFLQMTGMAATTGIRWTAGILTLFQTSEYLGALTTTAAARPVDCLVPSTTPIVRAVWRYLFSLFIPTFVSAVFAVLWGTLAVRNKKGLSYFFRRTILSIVAVMYISYLGLTELGIVSFYCVDISSADDPWKDKKESHWTADTSIVCYSKEHLSIVGISIFMLSFISLGFPLVSAIFLARYKHQHRAPNSWTMETVGFLFRAFKEQYVYWESFVMLRKACLSVIVVFAYPLGGQAQGLLVLIVLSFCQFVHFLSFPYRVEFHSLNYYEAGSLAISCLTFTLGQFFNVERCSGTPRALVAVVIVLSNILFFTFLIFAFVQSGINHLKVVLQSEGIAIRPQVPWWAVLKHYITFKAAEWF